MEGKIGAMDTANLTLSIAFLAGVLSFASPCVLPLVPAYIGYLSGTTVMSPGQGAARRETATTFLHSLFFVLGFGLVFILLGASATLLGRFLFDSAILLQRVGGVLLVVFGMRLMGSDWSRSRWGIAAGLVALVTFLLDSGLFTQGRILFDEFTLVWLEESLLMGLVVLAGADWSTARRVILAVAAGILNFLASFDVLVPNLTASVLIMLAVIFLNRADFFYADKKIELKQTGQTSYLRSLLFGVVFAAGWTPCVGPILAAILVMASQLETVGQGVLLLSAYTLGLGIPFLLVGLAFGPLSGWLRRMNRYLGVISLVSGVLLVLMGILIFTDSLTFLSQYGSFIDIEL
ncbi:MAG TPA: cytochrome c biogenesis protein CcdA [Anaerolineae bacterium]|nr:cytochrome c biogenesis protein CcdA [Anaerolineae bacterium]